MKLNKFCNIFRLFFTNIAAVCCKKFYYFRYFIKNNLLSDNKLQNLFWKLELKFFVLKSYIGIKLFGFNYRKLFFATFFLILFLSSSPFLYDKLIGDVEAQSSSLPNCDDLPEGDAADPMGGNCRYRNLPLCSDPSVASPIPRENCYDIKDLPVCEYIENVNDRRPMRNCVNLCSSSIFSNSNPAIFNRNCVRFCDDMPTGMVASVGGNCKVRSCHQTSDSTQEMTNCPKDSCDKLWPEEHEALFDKGWRYCDATNLKCFDLPQDLLTYVRILNADDSVNENAICALHQCSPGPGTDTCGHQDEYSDLFDNKSSDFLLEYNRSVSSIGDIGNGGIMGFAISDPRRFIGCTPLSLCPESTIRREYHLCLGADGSFPGSPELRIRKNPSCDAFTNSQSSTSQGSNSQADPECIGTGPLDQIGSCYKTVDCAINTSNPLCLTGSALDDVQSVSMPIDPYNSEFYRPAPSGKSVSSAGNLRKIRGSAGTSPWSDGAISNPNMCYSGWRNVHRAGGGTYFEIPLLLTTIEVFGFSLFNSSISPGICGASNVDGNRGTGYIYLKGSQGLLYHSVDDDVIYQKGPVHTVFDNDNAIHYATFCLRFKNTLCTQCEGKRECVPTMSNMTPSQTWSQICGKDLCRTFSLVENPVENLDGRDCNIENGDDMSNNACSSEVDTYLRARAVYYNTEDEGGGLEGRVCGYLDVKGHLAYDRDIIGIDNGTNDIGDSKTCQNDFAHKAPNCSGHDSASVEGSASEWRNIKKAQYVGNNQTVEPYGYYDINGDHHKQEHCAKVNKRVGPPLLYNIANIVNSAELFTPPLIITAVNRRYYGRSDVETDFYQPEVMVQYGVRPITAFSDGENPPASSCYNSTDRVACPRAVNFTGYNQVYLSLNFGEISGKSKNASGSTVLEHGGNSTESPATSKIYSEIPGVSNRISTELYVEKSFDSVSGNPTFCVYENKRDGNGNLSDNPNEVGCVKRLKPESGLSLRIIYGANGVRENDRASLSLNGIILNSNGTFVRSLTNEALFNVFYANNEKCSMDIENYKFCMSRDPCTALSRECTRAAHNLSEMSNNNNIEARKYMAIIDRCESEILPHCLQKRGFSENGNIFDILSSNEYGSFRCINDENRYLLDSINLNAQYPDSVESCRPGDESPFLYGWFNEVVVSKGAENMRRYVLAHKIPDGRMGMCKIDPNSPNLVDRVSVASGSSLSTPNYETNCLSGGNGRTCLCAQVPRDYVVSDPSKYYVRLQTSREAGMAIGYETTKVCNSFIGADRTTSSSVFGENFPITGSGNTAIGTCDSSTGWTYELSTGNTYVYPSMRCIDGTNPDNEHEGEWDLSTLQHRCVRQVCDRLFAGNPNSQGEYFGFYDDGEAGQCKGARNGFANWPRYLPDSDVDPSQYIVRAESCIAGFKPIGSSPVLDASNSITGYSGGNLPQRICNISGNYGPLTQNSVNTSDQSCATREVLNAAGSGNSGGAGGWCERISCEAINPDNPTSSTDIATWNEWFNSGGATFPSVEASRHSSEVGAGSIATGTCNRALGFFRVAGGDAPTRSCDYLGNWGAVENPCSTLTCDAINEPDASNSNHGFATWSEVTDADMNAVIAGGNNAIEVSGSCATGYMQNPYPPATDSLGNELPDANDLTRSSQPPKRYCIGGSDSAGNIYKIWRLPYNSCINQCPGSDVDDRIGVGVTTHATSSGTIEVNWPSTNFGEVQYISNWNGTEENLNASHFASSRRTNGLYLLRRRCGNDGRWEDAIASCALNRGTFGNATFTENGDLGYQNSIPSYTRSQINNRSSNPNFETSAGVCAISETMDPAQRNAILTIIGSLTRAIPEIYCAIPNNNLIDKVYLERSSSTSDCGACRPIAGRSLIINAPTSLPNIFANSQNRQYYPSETLDESRLRCGDHHNFIPPSDGTEYSLSATCDDEGSGLWSVENAQYCRASCRIDSTMLRSQNVGASDGCGDGGANFVIRSPSLSNAGEMYIRDREIFEFNAYRSCRVVGNNVRFYCSNWRYSFKCDNGRIIINHNVAVNTGPMTQNNTNGSGACPYSRYDYRSSSWGSTTYQAISENNYFVAYRHLPRPSFNATGMGMVTEDNALSSFYVDCTNCFTEIRHRGIAENANLSLYYWNHFAVNNINMYPDLGMTRINMQCSQYNYNGSRDIVNFNSLDLNQPGDEFIGDCGPSSILKGLAPKITCQINGSWLLENENNCIQI